MVGIGFSGGTEQGGNYDFFVGFVVWQTQEVVQSLLIVKSARMFESKAELICADAETTKLEKTERRADCVFF